MNFWKKHVALRFVLIALFFAAGLILTLVGWSMTGKLAGLGLMLVGIISAVGYLGYRYSTSSRSADYTDKERVAANQEMTGVVLERTDDWDDQTVVCIVDSAYRPLQGKETDYTVAVYVLDEEAFAAGQAAAAAEEKTHDMNTLWGYSKSGPKKDAYQSLVKVASADVLKNEKTGEILEFSIAPVE